MSALPNVDTLPPVLPGEGLVVPSCFNLLDWDGLALDGTVVHPLPQRILLDPEKVMWVQYPALDEERCLPIAISRLLAATRREVV